MKASSKSSPQSGEKRVSQVVFADSMQSQPSLRISDILVRQRWVILGSMSLGLALASLYWSKARVWYESSAKVLVSQRDPSLASGASQGENMVDEDVLANHMEVVRSRRIVEGALKRHNLTELPSILEHIAGTEGDATDYVIDHLKLSRGGEGTAKDARSLAIRFEHTEAEDARLILEGIVVEYQLFLNEQLSKAMSEANSLVEEARDSLEKELSEVQQEFINARQNAPVLYQGENSGNMYVEGYRKLHEELLELDIRESAIRSRLEKAKEVLNGRGVDGKILIEDLGIIDTESLTRLGIFAGMQSNAAKGTPFLAEQADRVEQARLAFDLIGMERELKDLKAELGNKHPDVKKLEEQIEFISAKVAEREEGLKPSLEEVELTPRGLLSAYISFLEKDATEIAETRIELTTKMNDAEKLARQLVEYELKEGMIKSRVDRTQTLFDGLVEQLRGLDIASGMHGYIHELLESPRRGEEIWPSLPLCGVGGLMLGLVAGLFASVLIDQLDTRFRTSSEIDSAIGLPILTRVGGFKTDGAFPIVADNSPEGESFRILRTLLLTDIRGGKLHVISATSPLPGDGKTTILANIAASFAKLNMSVVMIEGDMRRPTFHKRFNVPDERGLSDVLKGKCELDDVLMPSGVPNLTLMTSGTGAADPSELLQNAVFDELLVALKARFQLVIIDVGPVLAVSDPVIVAQKSDGMLLVVRSSNDTRQQVIDTVETLRSANAKMLGCVVNTYGSGHEFERRGYYGYYYSDRNGKGGDSSGKTLLSSRNAE
jgi:capsular exopolysaccharide synthesis family protein